MIALQPFYTLFTLKWFCIKSIYLKMHNFALFHQYKVNKVPTLCSAAEKTKELILLKINNKQKIIIL